MRYFTDSAYERMMLQIPRKSRSRPAPAPKGHPCHGCKRYGEGCVLPCYRGITLSDRKAVGVCAL